MNDMSRLLDSSDDELALSLLRSANEEPPPESLGRVAQALGVGGAFALSGVSASALLGAKSQAAAAGTAAAAAPVASAGSTVPWLLGVVAKPLAIGLVGGIATLGGINYATAPASKAAHSTTSVAAHVAAKPVSQRAPQRTPVAAQVEAPTSESASEPFAKPEPVRSNTTPLARPQSVAVPTTPFVASEARPSEAKFAAPVEAPAAAPQSGERPRDEALAKDLGLLAKARALLVAGNAAAALGVLDRYAAERQSGALETEASMLRIRALDRLGDRAGASRLARAFIAAHPERSHDESLRALAGAAR
ncbi:MAG: hypothetical protein ACOY0T_22645 [Myxococcota bacterium]